MPLNPIRFTLSLAACLLLLAAAPARAAEKENPAYFDDYPREAEIPEPMVYDLVRRLGADAGEFEINSLFRVENTTATGDILWAPEFEYAIWDGIAAELELPFRGTKLESLKGALQFTFGSFGTNRDFVHGSQLLYEKYLEGAGSQFIPTYILGQRFAPQFSYLVIVGPSFTWLRNERADVGAVANFTVFHNYSREVDLGLELNWAGFGRSGQELRIMPQLHLLFENDWKVQTGIGLLVQEGSGPQFNAAMRLIKEFN